MKPDEKPFLPMKGVLQGLAFGLAFWGMLTLLYFLSECSPYGS